MQLYKPIILSVSEWVSFCVLRRNVPNKCFFFIRTYKLFIYKLYLWKYYEALPLPLKIFCDEILQHEFFSKFLETSLNPSKLPPNPPKSLSKSIKTYPNNWNLLQIPEIFSKSLKTSPNPWKLLQIPRMFSKFSKLLQIPRMLPYKQISIIYYLFHTHKN